MTDLDTSSAQIRASQSDLSIANSSPRLLESNATTSTACINDVQQPVRRDLSSELLCPLCDQLFDRPVMVTCGHSYCEPCIERHTRDTRACVICKLDVGPFAAMIPSITLDNMVRKLKNQENIESSYDDLFICEEKLQKAPTPPISEEIPAQKMTRSLSQRSKRRLFFSIAGPTICSSPITPHRRRPLSPSARPAKSSLKIPPEPLNHSLSPPGFHNSHHHRDDSLVLAGGNFRRNGFGRRSERFTAATTSAQSFAESSQISTGNSSKIDDESDGTKLKRNSFLRRSLNAFRSKSSGKEQKSFRVFAQIPEHPTEHHDVPEGDVEHLLPEKPTKSSIRSLWKRLFMPKKVSKVSPAAVQLLSQSPSTTDERSHHHTTISFVRLENEHDDPEYDEPLQLSKFSALGYYTGIGRKFERVASGCEITLVVFGHSGAGKTTFVLNNDETDMEYVLDIIDPEYDNSNLPQAYMDACDAAYLLVDTRNPASILSAHQIHRNMKHAQHIHVQCEMLMNVPSEASGQTRVLSANALETTMKTIPIRDVCANQLDKGVVEEMLLSICERVTTARNPQTPTSSPIATSSSPS
ncbi:RING-type domain-containing protein [Caenorhabditis elegans]|uniref:RING-type domain-containing protein n=1 Tax=Caenorhabditis elegans TaxID=6239 RepID=A0A8S4SK97_CAEEL|nr:RING-type domain-containing protein [Caenorhabditis elegans]CAH2662236.1 RING-type domain-containing protein [Caenorhabditis elegans]